MKHQDISGKMRHNVRSVKKIKQNYRRTAWNLAPYAVYLRLMYCPLNLIANSWHGHMNFTGIFTCLRTNFKLSRMQSLRRHASDSLIKNCILLLHRKVSIKFFLLLRTISRFFQLEPKLFNSCRYSCIWKHRKETLSDFYFERKFSGWCCQNCNPRIQKFSLKNFVCSGTVSENFLGWHCENCNASRVQKNILRNSCFKKKHSSLILIGVWEKRFRTFGKKLSSGLSKLHSKCPEQCFEEKHIVPPKNCDLLIYFGHWAKDVGTFGPNFFSRFLKTAFYVSRGRFW